MINQLQVIDKLLKEMSTEGYKQGVKVMLRCATCGFCDLPVIRQFASRLHGTPRNAYTRCATP